MSAGRDLHPPPSQGQLLMLGAQWAVDGHPTWPLQCGGLGDTRCLTWQPPAHLASEVTQPLSADSVRHMVTEPAQMSGEDPDSM